MKKIGLLGGISWISTMDYYRLINEGINQRLGGLQFAECVIYSLNFGELQARGWENAFELLLKACKHLKDSKVEAIALCANTAHLFADQLEQQVALPIIHIGTATAKKILASGMKTVGLLGTKFTMEKPFLIQHLEKQGLQVLVPPEQTVRNYIQQTLRDELGKGLVLPNTKARYLQIAQGLLNRGAEGIILGCTEIPLLLSPEDLPVPTFDTLEIHVEAIIDFILARGKYIVSSDNSYI